MAFNIETEMCQPFLYFRVNVQKPVVRRSDITIHSISLYPLDNAIRFAITYLLGSDLSVKFLCNWALKVFFSTQSLNGQRSQIKRMARKSCQ